MLPLLISMAMLAAADTHIVLPPPASADSSLPVKMMVFIPGGKVPNERYVATARSIQSELQQTAALWVVIPAVTQRLCIIQCTAPSLCMPLHSTVEAALSQAVSKGWKRGDDKKDIYLAGHSLGGVCANTLMQAYKMPYAAMLVMGSYVDKTGAFSLTEYPTPVMTLNVELDGGQARPGKTSIWWKQFTALEDNLGASNALMTKPVVILPSLNHSNFCPGFDVPGDLMGELTQQQATAAIGRSAAAFLAVQIAGSAVERRYLDELKNEVDFTREFMTPYVQAEKMTVDRSRTDTGAEGVSKICAMAQNTIASVPALQQGRLTMEDGFHVSSPNLEHCHPNYTHTGSSGQLLVRTCSHTDYYVDIDNTGSIAAPKEVACKLLSYDRIAQQLNVTAGPSVPCSEVNKEVVALAEKMAHPKSLQRYQAKGKKWCFLADTPTFGSVGPVWVFKDAVSYTANSTCMAVSSPVLQTSITGKIYPGNMYCKFLTPDRVLDWIMTDSLKK